ncbi:hypothetical protein OESDEN_00990 [Oesophagostomum dentatum]|uniref:Uncharacterized protein n=1 Tax=Oesophagostomum dentatum TaxID=61180 RepID=A0A0B1TT45_OESDE|nr:hypothetical protein OESDEN_00990 [Oesophagostomum dentatum]
MPISQHLPPVPRELHPQPLWQMKPAGMNKRCRGSAVTALLEIGVVLWDEKSMVSQACLMCLEGSDCERDASCEECSGVACTRITSFNLEDNREVALTCIPYDTRYS